MGVNEKGGRLIGYARVSTAEQNLDMQIEALKRAGVHPNHLYVEKVSASSSRRKVLDLLLKSLRRDDTLIVWKLDRIARSMQDMLTKMERVKSVGAGFRSITEQIDTTTPGGIFLFHMLAAVAQLERDLIIQRTRAGVAAARARGVRFGQPPKLDHKQKAQCRKWRKEGQTVREIVASVKAAYDISISQTLADKYTKGLGKRRRKSKPKITQ